MVKWKSRWRISTSKLNSTWVNVLSYIQPLVLNRTYLGFSTEKTRHLETSNFPHFLHLVCTHVWTTAASDRLSRSGHTLIGAPCHGRWSDPTCLSAGSFSNSKQQTNAPCRWRPRRRKPCPVTVGFNKPLTAHHHVIALSIAATPRRPAGLQNDTMLLVGKLCLRFHFYWRWLGGSLSFFILCLVLISVISIWFSVSLDDPNNNENMFEIPQ